MADWEVSTQAKGEYQGEKLERGNRPRKKGQRGGPQLSQGVGT